MRTILFFATLLSFLLPTQTSAACYNDLTITKWDCMFSIAGTVKCGYKDYDVLRASSPTGPFVKIGTHDVNKFYIVPDHGYYKLKVDCHGICHETNVLYFGYACESACSFELDTPFPEGSKVKHCFDHHNKLHFDASKWVKGCSSVGYKWITPSGIQVGPVLHGDFGYGSYQLKVICHDTKCYHEELSFWFKIEEKCQTSYCDFDIHIPFSHKEYCYETDGDLWLSAANWISGCSSATYKWITPIGIVHGPVLEGTYGYGTFTLKALCHTTDCYYEEEISSFELKPACAQHCHVKIKSPLPDKIKHCYKEEGNIWIDAKTWVSGCKKLHYTWHTPTGEIHSSALDGQYGYGKYTLKVTCHDPACYYETASTSFVLVDDCRKPYHIYCPDDKWIGCDADLHNLDKYGSPYYIHHGKKIWIEKAYVHKYLDECKRGYITKKWTFQDPHGHWHKCTQDIFVGEDRDGRLKIDWPHNTLELSGCNPSLDPDDLPKGYQKPLYNNSSCAKLGHSYSDQEFYYNATCKKVIRTWSVIDWCVYNPNKDPNKGKYVFHQTIKINNDDSPVVKYDSEITFTAMDCETLKIELPDLEVTAESCGDKFYVSNDSPHAYHGSANASGEYPIGTTEIIYTVRYGCGYKKNYLQKITVAADDVLRAYCDAKIVMPLAGIDSDGDGVNDQGEAQVWAKDFDLGSSDLCGGEIYHSFSPDEIVMSKTFTCAEVGTNELTIYISDGKGQHTSCVVEIDIQNNAADITDCEPQEDTEGTEGNGDHDGTENETEEDNASEKEDDDAEDATDSTDDEEDATDNDDEDSTEDNQTDDDETEEDVDADEEDDDEVVAESFAAVSGSITTHYGLAMNSIEVGLHRMESTDTGVTTFTVVEVVVDSFLSRSGAMLYVIEQDTVYDDPITEEEMVLIGNSMSDESGEYAFEDLAMNEHYMIAPEQDQVDVSHIDINDANRLYAHLSGSDPLTDTYALLAADVNRSGVVDLDDLDYLLAFIRGEHDELDAVPMIFIASSYEFSDPDNPWGEDYSTDSHIESLDDDVTAIDFIAITLGDISEDESNDSANQNLNRSRQDITVAPNPFYSETYLTVNVDKSQMASLKIFGLDGSVIQTRSVRLSEGKNVVKIGRDDIPHSGVFIYQVKTDNNQSSGRIIKLQ